MAGSMLAAYAIGLLTGKFTMPARHFQFGILAEALGYVAVNQDPRIGCVCTRIPGYADLGAADAVITKPSHWPRAVRLKRR